MNICSHSLKDPPIPKLEKQLSYCPTISKKLREGSANMQSWGRETLPALWGRVIPGVGESFKSIKYVSKSLVPSLVKNSKNYSSPSSCVSVAWESSHKLKGHGFNPGQGTCRCCGFGPQSRCVWEATDQCFFLTLIFLSLAFSLPPLLSEINKRKKLFYCVSFIQSTNIYWKLLHAQY